MSGGKEELSKRLADKMLLGWTMLGDVCPVAMCHAPLMKDKAGSKWCISCDRRVMTEDDLKAEIDRTAAMTAAGRSSYPGAVVESESDRAARLLRIQQAAAAEPRSALAMSASTVRKPGFVQAVEPKVRQELTARELLESVEPTEEERSLGSYSLETVNYEPISLEQMMGGTPTATPNALLRAALTISNPSPDYGEELRDERSAPPGSRVAAEQTEPPELQPESTDDTALSSDEISAQLGKLLLQGWRMLEELCPVTEACPLMLEKSTGRKFSVALQKFTDELDVDSSPERGSTPSDSSMTAEPMAAPEPQPESTGDVKLSSSEISAQLGDLLLQGWRMLEEECPVTAACPLMQEKNTGRKFSVALQKFTDELDIKPGPDATVAKVTLGSPDTAPDAVSSEHRKHHRATGSRRGQVRQNHDPSPERKSTPPAAMSLAPGGIANAVRTSSDAGVAGTTSLDKTITTLVRKIMEATARLDQPVAEISDRILLAQLVGECGASIHALEKLR